jgi:hypothetical protein
LAEERKASSEMAFARDAVVKGLMQCDKLIQSAKEGIADCILLHAHESPVTNNDDHHNVAASIVAEKEKKESAAKKKGAAAIFSRMTAAVTKSAKTLTVGLPPHVDVL